MIKINYETLEAVKEVEITYLRIDTNQRESRKDFITIEEPLHIIVNKEHYVTIISTPIMKRELVLGYLITEGIIKNLSELMEIKIDAQTCDVTLRPDVDFKGRLALATPFQRVIISACSTPVDWPLYKLDRLNIPKVRLEVKVKAKIIEEATKSFGKQAVIYLKTGGVHAAAIYKLNGEIIAFSEDVGRHNAVDKVIGVALTKNIDLNESFLISTGRITGDISIKAARARIPLVASLAAAIDSGIEVAKRTNLTLIGFVRGNRMNIYTFPDRVV